MSDLEHISGPIKRTMRKLKLKAPVPKEFHEQQVVFEWAKLMESREPRLRLLNASMNGLQVSNPAIIVRAKRCGLKPGYPDIFLPARGYADCPGLFIELKRRTGGALSSEQKAWAAALSVEGYQVQTCHGADEAIKAIKEFLEME